MSDYKNMSVTFYIRAEDFDHFRSGGPANKDEGWVQYFGKPDDDLIELKADIDFIETKLEIEHVSGMNKERRKILVKRVFRSYD